MSRLGVAVAALLLTTGVYAAPDSTSTRTTGVPGGKPPVGRHRHHEIDPRVVQAFSQNPQGGPALTAALQELLATDPDLAIDIVRAARTAGLDQKIAAGAALAQAQQAYAQADQTAASAVIAAAEREADPQTAAAYNTAKGEVVASETGGTSGGSPAGAAAGSSAGVGGGGGGGGTTTASTGGTVSPH